MRNRAHLGFEIYESSNSSQQLPLKYNAFLFQMYLWIISFPLQVLQLNKNCSIPGLRLRSHLKKSFAAYLVADSLAAILHKTGYEFSLEQSNCKRSKDTAKFFSWGVKINDPPWFSRTTETINLNPKLLKNDQIQQKNQQACSFSWLSFHMSNVTLENLNHFHSLYRTYSFRLSAERNVQKTTTQRSWEPVLNSLNPTANFAGANL